MDNFNALNRMHLEEVSKMHPRSSIFVTRGFFDGTEGKPFGCIPKDWDGTTYFYEFRMVDHA